MRIAMSEQLALRQAAAERRLTEAVGGGASLCAIGRSRRPYPAVKYHEGAVAALREARSAGSTESAVRHVISKWVAAAVGPLSESAEWAAYRAGGIDELTAVLESPEPSPESSL